MSRYDAPLPGLPLTEKEVAVVELVAEGFTNPQVAHWLGLPLEVAKYRLERAALKLRAVNRAAVAHRAWQRGYLSPGGDDQ